MTRNGSIPRPLGPWPSSRADSPELHVEPLGRRDARALLESGLPARLDEGLLERIVAETQGDPLAPPNLPRGVDPTQLCGGFGLPAAVALFESALAGPPLPEKP